jgi:hypothetical protein
VPVPVPVGYKHQLMSLVDGVDSSSICAPRDEILLN